MHVLDEEDTAPDDLPPTHLFPGGNGYGVRMEDRTGHYNLRIPPPTDAPRRPASLSRSLQQSVVPLQLERAQNRSQGQLTVVSAKATHVLRKDRPTYAGMGIENVANRGKKIW